MQVLNNLSLSWQKVNCQTKSATMTTMNVRTIERPRWGDSSRNKGVSCYQIVKICRECRIFSFKNRLKVTERFKISILRVDDDNNDDGLVMVIGMTSTTVDVISILMMKNDGGDVVRRSPFNRKSWQKTAKRLLPLKWSLSQSVDRQQNVTLFVVKSLKGTGSTV